MVTSLSKQKQCLATYLSFWLLSEQCLATLGENNLATLLHLGLVLVVVTYFNGICI